MELLVARELGPNVTSQRDLAVEPGGVGVCSTPWSWGGKGGSSAQGSTLERRSPTHSQSRSEVEGWEGEEPTFNHVLALKSNLRPAQHNLTAVSLPLSPPLPQGTTPNPPLEFNNPVHGQRMSTTKRAAAAARQEGPENIYEQVSRDCP